MATSSDPENKATHDNELQIGESIAEDLSAGGIGAAVDDEASTAIFYRTKVVEFLGRSTQIVLQNDNGPCPLLAICNVLLLRNVIELSLDISEVSQQKLLSLVAERLLDSNSNLEGKDEGYVSNQQRNISDAIDLLPRLASGIDVNVLFRKIDDFEFTRECAIFDLLDIGLYHGWIVDPQDVETATAIGSKSYNALVGQLVALDTKSPKEENFLPDEEPVDFAAAATAALGVPSPSLSRSLSLNDRIIRRGDLEEEEVLMRVLKLSSGEQAASVAESVTSVINMTDQIASNAPPGSSETSTSPHVSLADGDNIACLPSAKIVEISTTTNFEDSPINIKADGSSYYPAETDGSSPHASEGHAMESRENGSIAQDCMPEKLTTQAPKNADNISNDALPVSDLHDSCGRQDVSEDLYSDHNDVEPLYEGEECILDSAIPKYEDREPVYEGESVLGKHVEQDETTSEQQWHLVKTFLKENASQLTIYGLFCLQEGLKERELCIFFRNNHFSTMFKYNGELYLLATDQGYINQQNLVWEKLNEVNGDTMFVRSDFNQFLPEDQLNQTWDDQHGINDLFAMDGSTSGNSTFKSDLELAKELQKQEFEKQPPRSQMAPKVPQSSASGSSRLIVGPQNSRHTSNTSPRPESKSKDKCVLM